MISPPEITSVHPLCHLHNGRGNILVDKLRVLDRGDGEPFVAAVSIGPGVSGHQFLLPLLRRRRGMMLQTPPLTVLDLARLQAHRSEECKAAVLKYSTFVLYTSPSLPYSLFSI